MYCPKCGSLVDGSTCSFCGTDVGAPQAPRSVNTADASENAVSRVPVSRDVPNATIEPDVPIEILPEETPDLRFQSIQNGGAPNPYASTGTAFFQTPPPSDYLVANIVALVVGLFGCCCMNVGAAIYAPALVVGIVFANLSRGDYRRGAYDLARFKAKVARICFWIGAITIVASFVVFAYVVGTDPEVREAVREIFEP